MRRSHALIYVALYLLAWAARLALMGEHRLHPDEALYGQWGLLIFSGRDPWLVSVPAYKPPLLPYVLSGMLALLGCHPYRPLPIGAAEWAVRLPGLVSGMVTVGLTGRLARQLYRSEAAGRAAALAVALSPFAILFSATGFLDPPMVALGLGGCVAALAGRPGWAGLLVGLSCAAKQTGLVWLPLTFFFVFARHHRNPKRPSASCLLHHLSFVIFHSIIVVGLVGVWDAVRVAQGTQSFWQTGVAGYGGLRLIWPVEVAPRLRAWAAWLPHLLGWPLLGVAVVGAVGLVIRGVRRRDWPALFDVALVGFCLLYVLVHWLWAFPVWDRYLLPLVPVMGVLTGRVVSWLLPTAALDRRHDLALAADERSRGYDRCAHNRWAKMAPVVAGLLTHRSARS
ncbi:MAG: glycosyltransferase family 39 protein, partial [Anaerolineae bacterium]|nr:glycosyltransferase family 39 protein [Anaerolineae bacterium]